MIPQVVLCLAYQRERMAYQNSSSNPYIVLQWCSDTICDQTCNFTNGIATPLHDNIGSMNFSQFIEPVTLARCIAEYRIGRIFTPLVFATTGGMGREASAFYRRLADLMAAKNNSTYSTTMAWMRHSLS